MLNQGARHRQRQRRQAHALQQPPQPPHGRPFPGLGHAAHPPSSHRQAARPCHPNQHHEPPTGPQPSRHPVRQRVAPQHRRLEENHRRVPHRWRPAQHGQAHARHHRLHPKQQRGAQPHRHGMEPLHLKPWTERPVRRRLSPHDAPFASVLRGRLACTILSLHWPRPAHAEPAPPRKDPPPTRPAQCSRPAGNG